MKKAKIQNILNQTHDIYNTIAPDFSITRGKWWHALDEFKNYAKEGDSILDLGCGNGRLAELFKNMDVKYLGMDNSEELIKIAQEKFKDKENIKFEVGDVVSPPYQGGVRGGLPEGVGNHPQPLLGKEGGFNLIFMLAVLHHIPTEKLRLEILKNIYQLLKPGGRLVMSNWNILRVKKYFPRFFDFKYKITHGVYNLKDAFIPWKPIGDENQRYVHSFTKGELKRLLSKAGFKNLKVYYENKGVKTNFFKGYNLMVIVKK